MLEIEENDPAFICSGLGALDIDSYCRKKH